MSSGLMMSGSVTERSSSVDVHAATGRTPIAITAAVRRLQPDSVLYTLIREMSSEAKVDPEGEVRGRRECLELRWRIASGPKGLRVDTRILGPDGPDVSNRGGGGEAAAAEVAARPRLGRRVAERQLAEPNEVAVLEEAGDRAARVVAHEGDACLLLEGCVAADE